MTAETTTETSSAQTGFAGQVRSSAEVVPGKPYLTDEAIGWLAHLYQKVGFGGTWTKSDRPHPSWDDRSFSPMGTYPRYDLTWAQWALGLMIDATPAWRDVYGTILGYMGDRFLEYWSLYEWIEHRGDDPSRENYPDEYRRFVPPGMWGKYNMIGWAGNGSMGHEYDPDPIRGGGSCNLMYKGYLNLVLSMYNYATGDDKYADPFRVVYDDEYTFEYDQRGVMTLMKEQWRNNPAGMTCEVSKIFPWCNNLTAVGMRIYDAMHLTNFASEYHNWKRYFRNHFMVVPEQGPIEQLCAFYDADLKYAMNEPEHQRAHNYMVNVWHGYPHDPALFERLYEGAIKHFYREQPDGSAFLSPYPDSEIDQNVATGLGAAVALELGDYERYAAMKAFVETNYGPTWDTDHGQFYLGLGLGEQWPRGQYNDWIMPSLVITTPGQWSRLVNAPNTGKFREPSLVGVDYPTVRVRQAVYDRDDRALYISVTNGTAAALHSPTSFQLTNLVGRFRVLLDDRELIDGEIQGGTLTVDTMVGPHTIVAQKVS